MTAGEANLGVGNDNFQEEERGGGWRRLVDGGMVGLTGRHNKAVDGDHWGCRGCNLLGRLKPQGVGAMQGLFVLYTVRADNRVKGAWIVRAENAEAAEEAFRAVNAEQLKENDEPLIPEGGYVTVEPLEFEGGLQQIW